MNLFFYILIQNIYDNIKFLLYFSIEILQKIEENNINSKI
jgi:hypothetical protein